MRARYHIAAFVVVALVAPLVAFGASDDSGPDRYTAAVSPTGVLPSQSASYAIALKNHPRSTDSASAAEIDIPTGFSIDSSPVATASCPTATTWGAVLDAANSKIVATAPDGGALCPAGTLTVSFSATAPSAEGVYTWTTQLEGASTTFALSSVPPATVVDGTPPDSSIEASPNDPSGVASASFSFSGDDGSGTGVAGFECELDGAGFAPCTSPRAYASLPDGSHTFEVRAHDGVGNTDATPATVEWTVDTTAPETTIDAAPADPSGVASASFSFSGGDGSGTGIAGFDCQLDGAGFAPCTSPQVYASLPDGSHTFEVRARDAAGNVDPTPASLTWLIDTAHPVVTLAEKPPALTNRTSAVFSFSSSKPGSTFECKLDAATFGPCDSPRAYDALADGAHTFTVRATALGNTGPPTTYSWTIDATAPQTAITTEPPTTSTSGSATFAFTSSEGGSTFLCSLDAGGFAPCASPKTYDGLSDGDHTFRDVHVADHRGRTGNRRPHAAGKRREPEAGGRVRDAQARLDASGRHRLRPRRRSRLDERKITGGRSRLPRTGVGIHRPPLQKRRLLPLPHRQLRPRQQCVAWRLDRGAAERPPASSARWFNRRPAPEPRLGASPESDVL
jgi:hypothetical protein